MQHAGALDLAVGSDLDLVALGGGVVEAVDGGAAVLPAARRDARSVDDRGASCGGDDRLLFINALRKKSPKRFNKNNCLKIAEISFVKNQIQNVPISN